MLEMLNNMLQEKLLEKEGQIVDNERKLYERDELVRELADKLMIANIEKEDMLSEYEKILESTIYNKGGEATERGNS